MDVDWVKADALFYRVPILPFGAAMRLTRNRAVRLGALVLTVPWFLIIVTLAALPALVLLLWEVVSEDRMTLHRTTHTPGKNDD